MRKIIEAKIKSRKELTQIISALKEQHKKIVTTNGCFDILHLGHIKYLAMAKEYGDILVVGVNSDASVKRNKGEKKPLVSENDRAFILASLVVVDYVTIFDEITPDELIIALKPDIHIKGGDYKEPLIESETVKSIGGKVVIVPMIENYSTTNLIDKIIKVYKD